jgi:hypothetical protein
VVFLRKPTRDGHGWWHDPKFQHVTPCPALDTACRTDSKGD